MIIFLLQPTMVHTKQLDGSDQAVGSFEPVISTSLLSGLSAIIVACAIFQSIQDFPCTV